MKCHGIKFNEAELQEMIKEVDVNGHEIIKFQDYLSLMARKTKKTEAEKTEEKVRDAFSEFNDYGNQIALND